MILAYKRYYFIHGLANHHYYFRCIRSLLQLRLDDRFLIEYTIPVADVCHSGRLNYRTKEKR